MTNIVAIAGAKQSGKSTAVNYLHGHEMKRHGFIKFMISHSKLLEFLN
jgi:ABC-type thiamine transport system ATPase subunit